MNGFDISTISGIYVGSTPYSAIYKGSTLVWSAAPPDYSKEYFTIKSLANNNTISVNNYFASNIAGPENGLTLTLYWSTDKVNWTSVTVSRSNSQPGPSVISSTITTLNKNEKIYIKGNAPTGGQAPRDGSTINSSYYNYFSSTANINVQGNIMSLLYGDNFENQTTLTYTRCFQNLFHSNRYLIDASNIVLPATTLTNYCYSEMFRWCSSLITPPKILPATTLASYCYYNMFQGCSVLNTTPELPATTLAQGCYNYMFDSCKALTTTPELPATTLATSCYSSMFNSCTSLITIPSNLLSATTLAQSCYSMMFYNCTSLTTAPQLPATTLANSCYSYMFSGCTSLTTAPELPATTLVSNCYSNMFYGCSSLNYIKAMFTTTPSTSYTDNWVYNVAASGTFIKNDSVTSYVTGVYGVPSGWDVYSNEKEEPFTIVSLSNNNTISIENTLGSSFTLYYNGNYNTISSSGTTTITTLNNKNIVRIIANTSSITRSSSKYITIKATGNFIVRGNIMSLLDAWSFTTLTSVGSYQFYNLFKDNTYLKDASGLILDSQIYSWQPAITLADYCYSSMFRGCTSLTTAPELQATTLTQGCYRYMFYDCTSLTTAPELPATTLADYCYSSMFRGCTSLTTAPELPATTLAAYCYFTMFYGCTSLNYIKALFTTTPSSTYTYNWVQNVATNGTFIKNTSATWNVTGNDGIPTGWTVQTATS